MSAEPLIRGAVHHGTGRMIINAIVIPIHQIVEIVQAQPPGRILGFMRDPGR